MTTDSGKIALVTGGNRGLGKDMALRLSEKGIGVIITYNTNATEAEALVAQITTTGQKAAALQLNTGIVSTFESFKLTLQETLKKHFGTDRFDFLINNAGHGLTKPFAQTTEEDFDLLMNVHFKGVYFLTQKLLPVINEGGRIINLSSGLARFTMVGPSAYASMKGAIETFTRYLAKELGPRGIAANVVAPGAIETDFNGGAVRDNADMNKYIAAATALGRVGQASDIGGIVAFLCTDDARWINAQRIEASGGTNL